MINTWSKHVWSITYAHHSEDFIGEVSVEEDGKNGRDSICVWMEARAKDKGKVLEFEDFTDEIHAFFVVSKPGDKRLRRKRYMNVQYEGMGP